MKRIMYLFEILIYVAAIIMAAMHWYYMYQYDYSKGAFIHVAAFLAYGVFIIIRIVGMFSEFEPVHEKIKRGILLLFGGCILLIVSFVLSYTEFMFPIAITVIALALFFVSARSLRGKAFIKLIITFIILVAILLVAAFFLGLERSNPINISELSQAEIRAYNLKMFVKSVGGASSYCFIPIIIAFWLADHFTDEMILENKQENNE